MERITMESRILFEDQFLVVVHKPAGIAVEAAGSEGDSLEDAMLNHYWSKTMYPAKVFVGVVHRLDKAVSGAIIFAKKPSTLKQLNALVADKKVKKIYHALVEGRLPAKKGKLINILEKDNKQQKAIVVPTKAHNGQEARLSYQWLADREEGVEVEVTLETGRYHQIRAQLAHLGCPIVGDKKYGAREPFTTGAIALHAYLLQFPHPATGEQITVVCPPPWSAASITH